MMNFMKKIKLSISFEIQSCENIALEISCEEFFILLLFWFLIKLIEEVEILGQSFL